MENEMNIVSEESKELANRLDNRERDLLDKVGSCRTYRKHHVKGSVQKKYFSLGGQFFRKESESQL